MVVQSVWERPFSPLDEEKDDMIPKSCMKTEGD